MEYVDGSRVALQIWQRDQHLHRMSLQSILSSPAMIDNRPPMTFVPSFHRTEAKKFYRGGNFHLEKRREIEETNRKLMQKLIEISGGRGTVTKRPRKGRSLNKDRQRKEEKRLMDENLALATRLSTRGSCFSTTKWDEQYMQSRQYKRQISKPHFLPGVKRSKSQRSTFIREHILLSPMCE